MCFSTRKDAEDWLSLMSLSRSRVTWFKVQQGGTSSHPAHFHRDGGGSALPVINPKNDYGICYNMDHLFSTRRETFPSMFEYLKSRSLIRNLKQLTVRDETVILANFLNFFKKNVGPEPFLYAILWSETMIFSRKRW